MIRWHSDKTTPTSGIGVVFIPTQAADTKPFLLTRTIGDKKTTEVLLGYAERHLDRTDIKSVVELHHAMRTGMNLEATLLNRITNLETLLQRQLASTPIPQPSSPTSSAVTAGRFVRSLAQPQLSGKRTLAIGITPVPRSELRSIFSEDSNSIRRAVEQPPELRTHGWGIRTGGEAQFIDGDFVQTESTRQVLNLYRDGELIVAVGIDRYGLAWSDKSDSRVHPLALVEFITNTLTFYRLVFADMRIPPQTLQIEIRLGDLLRDNEGMNLRRVQSIIRGGRLALDPRLPRHGRASLILRHQPMTLRVPHFFSSVSFMCGLGTLMRTSHTLRILGTRRPLMFQP